MSANNNITLKVQQAVQAFLRSETTAPVLAADIHRGLGRGVNQTIDDQAEVSNPLPCIIVECRAAEHLASKITGTWKAEFVIIYRSQGDKTAEDDHLTNAGAILDLLMTDTVAADISAALADFTAQAVVAKGQEYDIVGRLWESRLSFECLCCGSDIS